jgi:hypothetical protein
VSGLQISNSLRVRYDLVVRRRAPGILLILFQAVWFNVILPGHQRGVVQLPGASGTPSCCCCTDGGGPGATGTPLTPGDRAKNCAICFFAAHLSLPPVFTFDHALLPLLQKVHPQQREDLFARFVLLPFDSCGPPALS